MRLWPWRGSNTTSCLLSVLTACCAVLRCAVHACCLLSHGHHGCAVVPAGYYLKAPGMVAPCPMGEWKAGAGLPGNCTK